MKIYREFQTDDLFKMINENFFYNKIKSKNQNFSIGFERNTKVQKHL